MSKMPNYNKGKKLVERLAERTVLSTYKFGADEINYLILKSLPATAKEIEKITKLSPMPANRRINDLNKVHLLEKGKPGTQLKLSSLGASFLKDIENMRDEVILEMSKLIK